MRKSHFLSNGVYLDTTTGNKYIPQSRCEICKTTFPLSVHHFLNQQKCFRDLENSKIHHPKMWTKDFILKNQKLFTLCFQCHADVERLSPDKFKQKYGLNLFDFKHPS